MKQKSGNNLESLLSKKEKASVTDNGKLRLVLMAELELASKLSNQNVLYNVGEVIKKYDKRLDGIVINGGLSQIPNKYSKLRGERFDLLEDNIRKVYGDKVYRQVKGKDGESDSIDSLDEAAKLARVQMSNITAQAKDKGIPIYYVFAENDYKNVESLIASLEKISNYFKKHDVEEKEESGELEVTGVDPDLITYIQSAYKMNASQWKNKDKEGIKDIALRMYKGWIASIFVGDDSKNAPVNIIETDSEKEKKPRKAQSFMPLKRFENNIEINGKKIRLMHAINGLYTGNSEGKPTERGDILAVNNANLDAVHGRLADIYIRAHESATHFTVVDFKSDGTASSAGDKTVYLMNVGPLQNISAQIKRHESWNKTIESKRVDQPEDSGVTIFSLESDGRVELQHIGYRALSDGVDVTKLEKGAKKNLAEIVAISDTHFGAPSTVSAYEVMEGIPLELEKSRIPKKNRYLLLLGDIPHGGADKATYTDILWPQRGNYVEALEQLEKAKSPEEKTSVLRELVYGVSMPDLGEQVSVANDLLLSKIAKMFGTAYTVDGNHVQKAAGNAGEGGVLEPLLKAGGTDKVIRPDKLIRAGKDVRLGPYGVFMLHSAGYRGGMDPATALDIKTRRTGSNVVHLSFAGDCHEAHVMFSSRYVNGKWDTGMSSTSAALQDVTTFEKNILSKNKYTRGISRMYVPLDQSVGTSYIRYDFIPASALMNTLKGAGGSRLEKIVKSNYS